MIDYEQLKALAGKLSVPVATTAFPDQGEDTIRAVLAACRRIFVQLDPTQLQAPVVVFAQATGDTVLDSHSGIQVTNLLGLTTYTPSGFFLQIDPHTNTMHLWPGHAPLDVEHLRKYGIIFIHDAGNERLLISDQEVSLPRIFSGEQSFFSTPYYADLDDALQYYDSALVRRSQCDILERTWFDDNRLYLKAGPEDAIQRSLLRFLRQSLRANAEVMREQKVNETDPVDIRVTFQFSNRVALLEIK